MNLTCRWNLAIIITGKFFYNSFVKATDHCRASATKQHNPVLVMLHSLMILHHYSNYNIHRQFKCTRNYRKESQLAKAMQYLLHVSPYV